MPSSRGSSSPKDQTQVFFIAGSFFTTSATSRPARSLHSRSAYSTVYCDRACNLGFPIAQSVKNLPAMQETWVRSLGREDPLEKEMATHCSILAWEIPWIEELGGLQSTGSQSWARLSNSVTTTSTHFTVTSLFVPNYSE